MIGLRNTYDLKYAFLWRKFEKKLQNKKRYKILRTVKRKNVFVENNGKIT